MTSSHFSPVHPLYSRAAMSIVGGMRMKILITISILAAALQIAPVAFSQGRQRGGGGADRMGGMGANLTQEERQKLMTARRTAMQDPAVTAAKEKAQQCSKEFHDAMDAAMLKA